MSDVAPPAPNTPLGVGNIVSESFSILGKHFVSVLLLGLVPTLIGVIISGLTIGWGLTLGTGEIDVSQGFNWVPIVANVLLQICITAITTALLIQLAYDAKLNKKIVIGDYIGPALAAIVPIFVLSIVVGIASAIGFALLIIPGLWVYAVFYAMTPAIVIEKAGFGALGRSVELTKEYRWPIVGTIIVIGIIGFLIQLVVGFIIGLISVAIGTQGVGLFVVILMFSVLSAIIYGLGGIVISLIYARLREIKEGVSVDQIASVFD